MTVKGIILLSLWRHVQEIYRKIQLMPGTSIHSKQVSNVQDQSTELGKVTLLKSQVKCEFTVFQVSIHSQFILMPEVEVSSQVTSLLQIFFLS